MNGTSDRIMVVELGFSYYLGAVARLWQKAFPSQTLELIFHSEQLIHHILQVQPQTVRCSTRFKLNIF